MKESDILHQTANLTLIRTPKGLEILLRGATHSAVVGNPATEEQGRRFLERAERNIDNLRRMHTHPA